MLESGSTFLNHGSYGATPRLAVDYRLRYVRLLLFQSVLQVTNAS